MCVSATAALLEMEYLVQYSRMTNGRYLDAYSQTQGTPCC